MARRAPSETIQSLQETFDKLRIQEILQMFKSIVVLLNKDFSQSLNIIKTLAELKNSIRKEKATEDARLISVNTLVQSNLGIVSKNLHQAPEDVARKVVNIVEKLPPDIAEYIYLLEEVESFLHIITELQNSNFDQIKLLEYTNKAKLLFRHEMSDAKKEFTEIRQFILWLLDIGLYGLEPTMLNILAIQKLDLEEQPVSVEMNITSEDDKIFWEVFNSFPQSAIAIKQVFRALWSLKDHKGVTRQITATVNSVGYVTDKKEIRSLPNREVNNALRKTQIKLQEMGAPIQLIIVEGKNTHGNPYTYQLVVGDKARINTGSNDFGKASTFAEAIEFSNPSGAVPNKNQEQ